MRLDDHLVGISVSQPVFQQTAPGQSPDQEINFLVDGALPGKGAKRQTRAQLLRAFHRDGAEPSEAFGIAIEAGGEISIRLRFKRDVRAEPGGNDRWRDPPHLVFCGSAQTETASQVWGRNGVSSLSSRGRSNNPSLTGIS